MTRAGEPRPIIVTHALHQERHRSQPTMNALPRWQGARLWAVTGLLLALVLAQTLGLLHGIVHAPRIAVLATLQGIAPAEADTSPAVAVTGADKGSGNFLRALFAAHHHDSDCRVYDQLSHSDLLSDTPLLVLTLALPAFVFSLLAGLATARWHASFQARGPPSVR